MIAYVSQSFIGCGRLNWTRDAASKYNFVGQESVVMENRPYKNAHFKRCMTSSAEVSVLFKIAELAQRCGLRPSDAQATIHDNEDVRLDVVYGGLTVEDDEKIEVFKELIGMPANGDSIAHLTVSHIRDLEDIVDNALARAPRPRYR
jgi:hypothetical protein